MKTIFLKKLALICLGLVAFMANAQEDDQTKGDDKISIRNSERIS